MPQYVVCPSVCLSVTFRYRSTFFASMRRFTSSAHLLSRANPLSSQRRTLTRSTLPRNLNLPSATELLNPRRHRSRTQRERLKVQQPVSRRILPPPTTSLSPVLHTASSISSHLNSKLHGPSLQDHHPRHLRHPNHPNHHHHRLTMALLLPRHRVTLRLCSL